VSTVNAVVHLSLDGVMQAPGRSEEDTRDGFPYGGWAGPYGDHVLGEFMGRGMSTPSAMLFGRRTYEDFHHVWHGRDDGNPFTPVLDAATKYVVTRTLSDPLPWANSIALRGEAAQTVARLRETSPLPLTVLGSGELLRTLLRHDLVDELVLTFHPLVLGQGRRLFDDDLPRLPLTLVESVTTTTGVVVGRWRRTRT